MKQIMQIQCSALSELESIAEKIISFADQERVWIFRGEMAAGKTTLIKTICGKLGVVDTVSSPTFSIVNEYAARDGAIIYHFDFYRIKNEMEAMDIGVDEYFYSGNLCLIEWPSKVETLLPDQYLEIVIELETNTQRTISIHHYER